ncbi:MAG: MFS transporter [Catenulispora sp.]|nr:MFS transporter [Catenulispora sp.]
MTPLQRRLLLGRTTASLATSLIPTTLTLAIVHGGLHSGKPSALGLVLAAELVPMLLLLPVAGVVADRFPARRIIAAADLTRATAQAGIGTCLLTWGPNTAALATLAAITGAAIAFGTPAVRTLVSASVDGPHRRLLNARLSVWGGLAQFAGPAVAGTLTLTIGAGWAALLTAALFIGSATTLGAVRAGEQTTASAEAAAGSTAGPDRPARTTFRADLRAGWAETRRHPWFIANVLGHGVWHLTAGFLLTLGPVIAVTRLGGGTAWVVILQTGTVGMLAGVWAAGRLPIRRPLVGVAVGAAAYALPLAALATTAPLPLVLAAYFAAMFGLGVLDPLWETTLQRRIPADALGRVGSFDALISFAARPLGLAVAAPVAAAVGTTAPLAAGAVLVAAANLAVLTLPEVRSADAAPEPVPAAAPEPQPAPARPAHPARPEETSAGPAAEPRRPAPASATATD